MGIELVNHAPVVFRQGSAIERVPRDQFAELAATAKVGLETTVFDNTLTRVGISGWVGGKHGRPTRGTRVFSSSWLTHPLLVLSSEGSTRMLTFGY